MRSNPTGSPGRSRKPTPPNKNQMSASSRASSDARGVSSWSRFVADHSRDERIALSAHHLYDAKFLGASRRLGALAGLGKGLDTGNCDLQKARSNLRAILAEVVAYGQLRRDFLDALTAQIGEVSLVSGVEITGTKIEGRRKRWTDLAPFSLIRFERAKKPTGEVLGVARHFAQITVKTSARPSDSMKRGIRQFGHRDSEYWDQGGHVRYLGGSNQGVWKPEFADDLDPSRWIMLSGRDNLPSEGQPHKERFLLIPLAARIDQLDAAVDQIVNEISPKA